MDRANYLRSHPPRCLAGLATREEGLPGVMFDGHGESLNTVFLISCGCGHDRHHVLGHFWRDLDDDTLSADDHFGTFAPSFLEKIHERARQKLTSLHNPGEPELPRILPRRRQDLVFLSPLATRCAACEGVTDLIDTDRHGYDAEIGAIVATKRGEGDRVEFECEDCGRKPFRLWVRFEYSHDVLDRGISGFQGRREDLFSWFSLVGECAGCSRLLAVADFECA
jgi:hypothetical protein